MHEMILLQLLFESHVMFPLAAGEAVYPELQLTENTSPVCPLLLGDTLTELGIM